MNWGLFALLISGAILFIAGAMNESIGVEDPEAMLMFFAFACIIAIYFFGKGRNDDE